MAPWGPVFQPSADGDFTLNLSDRRPTFLPSGPGLERRRTVSTSLRPILVNRDTQPTLELRSPREYGYRDGQVITTVARSPRRQSHRRSLSSSFRNYETAVRSPRSSRSPAVRFEAQSPRLSAFPPFPARETYVEFPQPEPIVVTQPQPYPVYIREPAETRGTTAPPATRTQAATVGSDDDEAERPTITVAESSRRRRRDREYRDEARRHRQQGRAPPERDESGSDSDAPVPQRSSRRSRDIRATVSTPPAPQNLRSERSGSSRSERNGSDSAAVRRSRDSPRRGEVMRTTEYRRTYEYERSGPSQEREAPRSAPPTQVRHSRSPTTRSHKGSESGSLRSPNVVQRPRAHTDASGFLSPTVHNAERRGSPARPLLLEDSTADRARHLVEERTVFGNGRKSKQYTYA